MKRISIYHKWVLVFLLVSYTAMGLSHQKPDTSKYITEHSVAKKQLRDIQKRVSVTGNNQVLSDLYQLQSRVDTSMADIHRDMLITLGLILSRQGNYSDALHHYLNVLPQIDTSANQLAIFIHVSMRIAKCFLFLSNHVSANFHMEEALKKAETSNHPKVRFNTYRMAGIVIQDDNPALALKYFNEAQKSETKKLNSKLRLGNSAHKIISLLRLNKTEEARQELELYRELANQVQSGQQFILYQLAEADYFLKTNQLDLAAERLSEFDTGMPLNHRRKFIQLNRILHLNKNEFQKSYEFLVMENAIDDSIYQLRNNQIIFDLEKKYQTAKKQKIIQELELVNQVSQLKIQQKNRWLIFSGFFIICIASFLFFLSRLHRKLKKSYAEIEGKNAIISKALEEKAYLIKEVHHRVKNNLQVISSLFSLQASFIKDEKSLEAINEGRDRIRSMVLLHQQLYNEDHLMDIHVKPYLERLCANLFAAYGNHPRIKLELDIEDMSMDLDQVTSVGLIVNELVTNCLKHAFVNHASGSIFVQLHSQGDRARLTVEDDGKGIESTQQPIQKRESFGYHMIRAFLKKIDGTMKIRAEKGFKVIIDLSKRSS